VRTIKLGNITAKANSYSRHGWGCIKDEAQAVTYLSAAASNSAAVEAEALLAGMKKGGAAKGELVLAIFELANCFRNGWGVAKDPAAARQYYETAANLGDTDAMNEVAWCYLEGFGGKKEKVSHRYSNHRSILMYILVQGSEVLSTCGGEWVSHSGEFMVCNTWYP
jgi:TPR repeat protein